MEIALQPCGFLSAYMGSTLPYPDVDFYFRNLDGQGQWLRSMDLVGKTVVNEVELLSSTAVQGIIIQKFSYALTCDDVLFYQGTATFGYFTAQALAKQVGLDGGCPSVPWYQRASIKASAVLDLPREGEPLRKGQLDLISKVRIVENGGHHNQGYIYATVPITPQDWFFDSHFYQDPVMPGSLGVEAVMQAMKIYARHQGLDRPFVAPVFDQVPEHEIMWAYRGQVTPDDAAAVVAEAAVVAAEIHLDVHIRHVEVIADDGSNHNGGQTRPEVVITGDANVWNGALRIYRINQVALRIVEGAENNG
jgi:3-hydroxymyristoyl/3-hydroxydecanoyl-(acyl carrier protein) dehydratase